MKTFSEQYVFLVDFNLKKQKFMEVFKFCDLFIYLFIFAQSHTNT